MSKDKIIKILVFIHTISDLLLGFDKIENAVQDLVKLYRLLKEFIIALLTWIAFPNLKNIWQRKLPSRSPIYNISFTYIFMQEIYLAFFNQYDMDLLKCLFLRLLLVN